MESFLIIRVGCRIILKLLQWIEVNYNIWSQSSKHHLLMKQTTKNTINHNMYCKANTEDTNIASLQIS